MKPVPLASSACRAIGSVLLPLSAFCLPFLSSLAGAGNALSATVSPCKADFGEYPANQRRMAAFRIENKGSGMLKILKVEKTCGCADILLDKTEIASGESASMRVDILPDSIYGEYAKSIYIETDDPANKLLCVSISGTAVPLYAIKPKPLVDLGRLEPGKTISCSFRIEPVGGQFELGEPQIDCRHPAEARLERLDDGAWRLNVKLAPAEKDADLCLRVVLPLKNPPGWKSPEIAMVGRAGTQLACVPSRIFARRLKAGTGDAGLNLRLLGWAGVLKGEDVSFSGSEGTSADVKGQGDGSATVSISFDATAMDRLHQQGGAQVEFTHKPSGESAKITVLPPQ